MFRPDRLCLTTSPISAWLVVLVHGLAAVASLINALPLPLKMLLLGVIAWQAVYLLRRYVWLTHSRSVREIRWTERTWAVQLGDGAECEVIPVAGCRVLGWITLLRFRIVDPVEGRRATLNSWVFPDSGSNQAIRRLRVQLIQTYSSQSSPG
ncbi:MAG: protein YgfX [Halopseudomonas sp.]